MTRTAARAVAALRSVSYASLERYEVPDERVVAGIASSIATTGVVRDPIVIDQCSRMIIDGHHRAEALMWSGITEIPCLEVDYRTDNVEVRGWQWATEASPRVATDLLVRLIGSQSGESDVVIEDPFGSSEIRCGADDAWAAAYALRRACLMLDTGGLRVARLARAVGPEMPLWCRSVLRVDPLVDKDTVREAAKSGRRLPPQVNRHLLHGRIVGLRVPLDALTDHDMLTRFATRALAGATHHRDGWWDQGRYYEEEVIVPGARAS